MSELCVICCKPVPDYKPTFCCDGHDCVCHGLPIEPCICSPECWQALLDYIGMDFEGRRIKAGIKKWGEQ